MATGASRSTSPARPTPKETHDESGPDTKHSGGRCNADLALACRSTQSTTAACSQLALPFPRLRVVMARSSFFRSSTQKHWEHCNQRLIPSRCLPFLLRTQRCLQPCSLHRSATYFRPAFCPFPLLGRECGSALSPRHARLHSIERRGRHDQPTETTYAVASVLVIPLA